MDMLILGFILIALAFFYLYQGMKHMKKPMRDWTQTTATVLDERKIEPEELMINEFGVRELKICYYAEQKKYIKYILRKEWQLGEEEEIRIRYNPTDPNIFEEVNELKDRYWKRNKYVMILMFGLFSLFFIAGMSFLINANK